MPAGNYALTITDANNCIFSESYIIDQPELLATDAVLVAASCNGLNNGAIDLNTTGGTTPYTYLWSNGYEGPDPSGLYAATYLVTISDANGCSLIESHNIGHPDVLAPTVEVTEILCYGELTGAIETVAGGGTSPYTYAWSTGAGTPSITDLGEGFYELTITDANDCTFSESYSVTSPPLLSAVWVADMVDCHEGNTGSIDLTVNRWSGRLCDQLVEWRYRRRYWRFDGWHLRRHHRRCQQLYYNG